MNTIVVNEELSEPDIDELMNVIDVESTQNFDRLRVKLGMEVTTAISSFVDRNKSH